MSNLKHLEVLTQEELSTVRKFQEYGVAVQLNFGNKALWYELVHHTDLYSDTSVMDKLTSVTNKANQQELLRDAGEDDVNDTEFSVKGATGQIPITTREIQLYLRSVRKVRKAFKNLKEAEELDEKINKLQRSKMSKEERINSDLDSLIAQRNKLLNIGEAIPVTPTQQPEEKTTQL